MAPSSTTTVDSTLASSKAGNPCNPASPAETSAFCSARSTMRPSNSARNSRFLVGRSRNRVRNHRAAQRPAGARLYGYPSMLARPAREQEAGRLPIPPMLITCTSEMCTPERAAISTGFGAPLVLALQAFYPRARTAFGIVALAAASQLGVESSSAADRVRQSGRYALGRGGLVRPTSAARPARAVPTCEGGVGDVMRLKERPHRSFARSLSHDQYERWRVMRSSAVRRRRDLRVPA